MSRCGAAIGYANGRGRAESVRCVAQLEGYEHGRAKKKGKELRLLPLTIKVATEKSGRLLTAAGLLGFLLLGLAGLLLFSLAGLLLLGFLLFRSTTTHVTTLLAR